MPATQQQIEEFYAKVKEKVINHFESESDRLEYEVGDRNYLKESAAPLFGENSFENQFDYKKAAQLVYMTNTKIPTNAKEENELNTLAEELDYDFEAWSEAFNKKANQECQKLANDPYFQYYARDYLLNHPYDGLIDGFSTNEFASDYLTFRKKVEKATNNWIDIISDSDLMEVQSTIMKKVEVHSKNSPVEDEIVTPTSNVKDAVDAIVCKTLMSKAGQTAFFKGVNTTTDKYYNTESGDYDDVTKYSENDLKKRIDTMREEIVKDPLFTEIVGSGKYKVNEISSAYMKAVNLDMNKRIKNEKSHNKQLAADSVKRSKYIEHLNGQNNVISEDEFKKIKDIYENLVEFNEGKKPSKLMKNLMDVYKEIIDGNDRGAAGLYKLNQAALNYYNDRQGTFFYPFTDNGKARLSSVESLIKITEPKMKSINKEFENANKTVENPKSEQAILPH